MGYKSGKKISNLPEIYRSSAGRSGCLRDTIVTESGFDFTSKGKGIHCFKEGIN